MSRQTCNSLAVGIEAMHSSRSTLSKILEWHSWATQGNEVIETRMILRKSWCLWTVHCVTVQSVQVWNS